MTLVPTAALAEAVDFNSIEITALDYSYDETEGFMYIQTDRLAGDFPSKVGNSEKFVDVSKLASESHQVTVTKPGSVTYQSEVYVCSGVIYQGKYFEMAGLKEGDGKPTSDAITKFDGSATKELTISESDITSFFGGELNIAFIWEKAEAFNVTYDFSGPAGTTVYPVFAKFKGEDSQGSGVAPYSLGYFTVAQSENNLNLIKSDSDDPFNLTYNAPTGQGTHVPKDEDKAKAVKLESNKYVVKAIAGNTVSLPKLAQHRNLAVIETTQVFYPVVSFIAVGTNGKYYEFNGWKVNGQGNKVADLYDSYEVDAATTLKADWKEITLTETAAGSIPEVPLLSVYNEVGGVPVKLQQKTTGSAFGFESVTTDATGALTYEVSMKFSDLFSSSDMPWSSGGKYFKSVDNENFADVKINVKLDDHLIPAADEDDFTTITVSNASLKITGVEVGGQPLGDDDVQEGDNTHTIKAKLDGAQKFTIDLDWDKYSSSEMTVQIPTKVVDDYSGPITGTTVTVTGKMDFTQAHKADNSDEGKAAFTADEFVRYLISSDDAWYEKYGKSMTLTDMLQAAKDVQTKLKNFELTSNTLTATASEKVDSLKLDKPEVTVNVNETATVTPTITPDTANKEVTWSVDEAGKDIVSVENGVITGLKPGEATVTCTSVYDPNKIASVKVTVNGIVYVEPTLGGTVTLSGEGVTKILDNVYSVKHGAAVTVTVTPNTGNSLAGDKPSVYYGTNTPVEGVNGSGTTFTFTLPDTSPVYVSAVFVIKNDSGNTVIDAPKTVADENNTVYTDVNKVNVVMDDDAVSEMLGHVTADGAGQYSVVKLQEALTTAGVTDQANVYRHIQTQTKISVTEAKNNEEIGKRKIELNIDFQYRVVASNQADPDAIKTEGGSSEGQNSAIIRPTDSHDNGWVNYESTKPTYIVVPMPDFMGKAGDWIKVTHTHNEVPLDPQYLQIQSDGTVTYINNHEGYSPFLFEAIKCIKNIQIDNSGEITSLENFTPATSTYNISVGSDVESLNLIPETTTSAGTGGLTVTLGGEEVANTGAGSAISYRIDLVNNSVNTVEIEYNGQTYTINITRGTLPSEEQPAEPSTTPTYPSFRPAPSTRFYDVDQTAWYVDAINYVVKNGLMNGVSETDFAPNDQTNRAMLVTILYRLDGEPAVTKNIPFSDVAAGEWYSDAINWAAANEIVGGYGDGTFRPDRDLTREEAATILYRYATYKKYDVTTTASLAGYTDAASVQSYATAPMSWAVGTELIGGTTATTLSPSGGAIRAQIATILMRFCENIVK